MTPQPQALPPIAAGHPAPVPEGGFPILAIAILGITATAFLLVSYYIFVTKCCFRWQLIDPLRHFSLTRARLHEDPSTTYSPTWRGRGRGLDELLIREIPTFQFKKGERSGELSSLSSSSSKCVVCLNEFQESDMLRLLPKCSHAFHLDCIDVWLLSNSNCPLCRAAISGRNRYKVERIVAPNSSPQDPTGDDDLEIMENGGDSGRFLAQSRSNHSSSRKFFEHKIIGKLKGRKAHHVSIMGDEGINLREKDDQFFVQPIRRSFSMDSAVDRDVYLSVQEILRQNRGESEESGSRSRRSIFSRGSRNSVLPY